jgi:hypothetical protein
LFTVQIVIVAVSFALWIGSGFRFDRDDRKFVVLRSGQVTGVRGRGLIVIVHPLEKAMLVYVRQAADLRREFADIGIDSVRAGFPTSRQHEGPRHLQTKER